MPTFFGRSSLDIMWCTIYKRLLAKNNKIDLFSPEVFLTILFMPITRPVQIVDPMGFHLKIKLATRPNCRPDGNFALNKIRDSVRIDLLSGFKDWVCFGKIGYKYGYLHCISSFKHKPFKKSLLKGQKALEKISNPS